jgi:hypothetical protein
MLDQRGTERANVYLELQLARKAGRTINVRTLDVGFGGARVISERPLRVDEELHFECDLPTGSCHLDGMARVLRQDRHNVYALRFEHVAPELMSQLRAFVANGATM